MDTITIPYGQIYKFTADTMLTEKIYNEVKILNFKPLTMNSQSDDLYYNKELFDWFSTCIRHVADKLLIPKELELPITSCWANKTKKLETHHAHTHSNSFMSGIFYLTDHANSGHTVFTTTNLWGKHFEWLTFDTTSLTTNQFTIAPAQGTLLLFPSCLKHKVNPLKENVDRYSIAFNVFFSGKFGNQQSKTYLSFTTQSVEDRLKTI